MNDPFAVNIDNRTIIPVAKNKAGFEATQEPKEYINQALFRAVTNHIWGTQSQVANLDANFYTDISGNPLDKNDAAVTINEDDKILIAHDVTATANQKLVLGGKKVRIEMLKGVNWNLDTFNLDLGATTDSFSGDLELTGTGTLTITVSNGFRVHHTAMTIVNTAGDIAVNNDPFSATIPVSKTENGAVGTEILPSRGDHSHIALPMIIWRMITDEDVTTQNPLGAEGSGIDWEVADDISNESTLGGATSVTESFGTFSFASTGFWAIRFYGRAESNVTNERMDGAIFSTNNNSTYTERSRGSVFIDSDTAARDTTTAEALIKVSSTTLDKVRMAQLPSGPNSFFNGHDDRNETYVVFEKKSNL